MFQTLHLMFETQYNELALAVDLIAERIRALGYPGAGHLRGVRASSRRSRSAGRAERAKEMIAELVEGQEAVVRTARSIFPAVEKANDEPTRRPAHPAHAGAREDGVDAAVDAREVARPLFVAARGGQVTDMKDGRAAERKRAPGLLLRHNANFATAFSSQSMPWPGRSGTRSWPSLTWNGSARIGSAQSCHSSQCAVSVTRIRCAAISG